MATQIDSNGSKWYGEQPDSIEKLLEVLGAYALDPTFEQYGNFIEADPHGAKPGGYDPATGRAVYIDTGPIYAAGTTQFWGNFAKLSHVFRIASDEPEVIERLTQAIRANQATPAYLEAKAANIGRLKRKAA